MKAVRIETIVSDNGDIYLAKLPFPKGERVEVTVVAKRVAAGDSGLFPLRGTPIEYIRPTDPVSEEEWGALR